MRRAHLVSFVVFTLACGASSGGSTETTPASANGVAPPPSELPGLSISAARPLTSLDATERRTLATWLLATSPHREAVCADGHTAALGYRADITEEEILPPVETSGPPECTTLTVMDLAGCQLVTATFEPCDAEHVFGTWQPGGACAGLAGCLEAGVRASREP
jgi:hypothetical protein